MSISTKCFPPLLVMLALSAASMPASVAHSTDSPLLARSTPLVIAVADAPLTLNPIYARGDAVSRQLMPLLFAQLTAIDAHGRIVPDLLRVLPTLKNGGIRDGGTTVVLQLKRGMRWSSGREITSADIRFGWQIAMDPLTGPFCRGTCDHVAAITVPDRYTAVLHLAHPDPSLLVGDLPPVWPRAWKELGRTPHAAALHLSATTFTSSGDWTDGPYQVQQVVVLNEKYILTPMPYYRLHPGTRVSRIVVEGVTGSEPITAEATQRADVTLGYSVYGYAPPDPAPAQTTHPFRLDAPPSFDTEHVLEFNVHEATYQGRPNPLLDARVRQALSLALDRASIVHEIWGLDGADARDLAAYSPLVVTRRLSEEYGDSSLTGAWDPLARRYLPYGPQALADARTLLAQAGYGAGLHLDIRGYDNEQYVDTIRVVQRQWAQIGVQLTYQPIISCLPTCEPFRWLTTGDFEIAFWRVQPGPDPDTLRTDLVSSALARGGIELVPKQFRNLSGIADPLIDRAMAQAGASFDPRVRAHWYSAMQRRVVQQAYWAPLYYLPNLVTYSRSLRDAHPSPWMADTLWDAYRWKRAG